MHDEITPDGSAPLFPVSTGAHGERHISPTDVAQFIRLEQCERYLRLRLHERTANPRFMADYGVTPQSIPSLLTRSGADFERKVEAAVRAHYRTLNLATDLPPKGRDGDDNDRVLAEVRALAPGDTIVLFQPRLRVRVEGWLIRGDVDILRLSRDDDGALRALIVDMKSSTAARIEHRLQVAFYHEMLAALLAAEGVARAEITTGVLYRGPNTPESHPDDAEAARRARERVAALELLGADDGFLELVSNPDDYRGAVRDLVTDARSVAARVSEAPFDEIPYHLTYKCDGCLYNEFCMKRSAKQDDLSLLPHLTAQDKNILRNAGVRTTRELAMLKEPRKSDAGTAAPTGTVPTGSAGFQPAPVAPTTSTIPSQVTASAPAGSASCKPAQATPSGDVAPIASGGAPNGDADTARSIGASNDGVSSSAGKWTGELEATPGRAALVRTVSAMQPTGARLDELIHRARRYRRWKGDDVDHLSYIPGAGYGSLPYCDAAHNPNLVRIYIDAQHDYLHDRIYMLGALVVACEGGAEGTERRRGVVRITPGPPEDAALEEELFRGWVEETVRAVVELAAPDAEGAPRVPIHLIFYNSFEQRLLLDGLARHADALLGATPLYDFITQLAAFDSPVASFLDEEIRAHKNYPMVCQSLQAVAAYLKFDWNSPAPYRELFRTRLFDFWGKLERGDDDPETAASPWYTSRARFNSQIPLEYAYAAWGELAKPEKGRDDLAPYRVATRDLLAGFHARRLEALEHIARDFPGNRQTEKRAFELPDLRTFEEKARSLAQALDEFVTIERHVALGDWKRIRLAPPERRALAGETLLARYLEEDQAPGVAARNRENARRQALRKRYDEEYRAARPDAKRVALSKEQRAETAWSPEGLRVRLRLDCAGVDCGLDELLALSTLRDGSRVVINPRTSVDSRLPAQEQVPFTPTPRQMLYGPRGTIARVVATEHDAIGRITAGYVELTLARPSNSDKRGFAFGSFPDTFTDGALYTLDEDPNDWYGAFCATVVEGLCAGERDTLHERLVDPAAARVEWPNAATEAQERFLAGLDALHALDPALVGAFEPSKRAYIGGRGDAPTVLAQGPPGTGKSYATAFALFARLQGAMAAGMDYRAFLSCKTHAATDVLLGKTLWAHQLLRRINKEYPALFARYFDPRLLDVPLFRVRPREAPEEGIVALPRDDERPTGALPAADHIMGARWCVVATPPAGIRGLIKDKWPKELFGHDLADALILDEASQLNLPEAAMAALPLKRDGHLIVVGDHRQMPPIVRHDWVSEPRRTFMEYRSYESLFQTLLPLGPSLIQFEESFRLHEDMAEFLRREVYVRDGIDYHSKRRDTLPPFAHPDPFVAAILAPRHPLVVVVHDEDRSQARNPYEQGLVAPVLEALADPQRYAYGPRRGLGVVVPHRAQRAALQAALPQLTVRDEETGTITLSAVDTVERFQGDERTVIVVSATESDRDYLLMTGDFLLDPRRLTVALSRATSKMILVASRSVFSLFSADEETFAHAQLWKNLLRRTCTAPLWSGERDGHRVEVWGNQVANTFGHMDDLLTGCVRAHKVVEATP